MRTLNIIVVDDEEAIGGVVASVLRREGHEVEAFSDSRMVLALVGANPEAFDLVITDHEMPGLPGYTMVQELRAKGFHKHVIVLSGAVHLNLERVYQDLNVDFIIKKPFRLENIREAVSVLAKMEA